MRIVFMGTPDFAVPSLERLIADGHEVCAVFTQPDRPRGRGYRLCPPPVKEAALRHGLEVYQPEGLKDGAAGARIADLAPELIVVTAYGRILPEGILRLPPLGCVNLHASLLPKYRGAAPIRRAIIEGETVTGLTTMYMEKGLDTGDIILSRPVEIGPDENFGSLHDRMKLIGAGLLSQTLRLIAEGRAPRTPQPEEGASYAKMIDKSERLIRFDQTAQRIHNLVRGLSPSPSAYTTLNGRILKVLSTALTGKTCGRPAGTVAAAGAEGISVCCGDGGVLLIKEVQEQGSRRMPAGDYLRGHPVAEGSRFG